MASGTGTDTSIAPLPMITAVAVALACWPTMKGIDATLPAIGLEMVAWFNWSCAWASTIALDWIVAWSVIRVAAVTVPPPVRERPAAAAACSAELLEDKELDFCWAAAAWLFREAASAACCALSAAACWLSDAASASSAFCAAVRATFAAVI